MIDLHPMPHPDSPLHEGFHMLSPSPLRLAPSVLRAISRACRKACEGLSPLEIGATETGGKALGCWLDDGSVLAVLPLEAGPMSEQGPYHFRPDIAWQQARYEQATQRHPRLRLVLDWHFHPLGPTHLSARDLATFDTLLGPDGWGIEQVVALLVLPKALAQEQDSDVNTESYVLDETLTLLAWQLTRPVEGPLQLKALHIEAMPPDDLALDWLLEESSSGPLDDLDDVDTLDGSLEVSLEHPRTHAQAVLEAEVAVRAYSRNAGLVQAEKLRQAQVVCVGLGSVGAPLVLLLAQAGVGRFVLMDPDALSPENLSRHIGDRSELGVKKEALVRNRLLSRDPAIEVLCPRLNVCEPAHACALEALLDDATLFLVTTDDPVANLAAHRLALSLGIPSLAVGIFEEGLGGEIFAQYPGVLGCYNCVAAFRAALPPLPRSARAHDYSSLRRGQDLPPMNALALDIAHTVAVAARAALTLLETQPEAHPQTEAGTLHPPVISPAPVISPDPVISPAPVISPENPLLLVGNGRTGWIFEQPFEVIRAHQQSPGCALCGGS